jgi:hypothetical protein
VIERVSRDAEITPILFGGDGEILWQGRSVRTATPAWTLVPRAVPLVRVA